MAKFIFTKRPRAKMTNLPETYDIAERRERGIDQDTPAGTLEKRRKGWYLAGWMGVSGMFDSKLQLHRHLITLGHTSEGLIP